MLRHSTKELFYGFPAALVADWCCVSLQTARHWKSGIRKPGPSSLRLFILHRDGRVLTDEWKGWGVLKGKLCDPEGHEISQPQLRAWPFVWELAAAQARDNAGASELMRRLLERFEVRPSKQRGKQNRRQEARDLLPRVTPDPSTLPTVILPRTTRKYA